MTTVRGTLRSTETVESEASASTVSDARAAAVTGVDLVNNDLLQLNTVASKATGESTVRAIARSRATRQHKASGPTYEAAAQAFRDTVPDGWQVLSIVSTD